MNPRKARIAGRFASASASYDAHSPVQRLAAQRLAERIRHLDLPVRPRVLEIGCGTGHLTRELMPELGGTWIVSDIAEPMVAECRRLAGPAADYMVMDGERPALADGSFDLIISSLALQWFIDLPAALTKLAPLLAPQGHMALVTLGADTFVEWRLAHEALGESSPTPAYPDKSLLCRAFPDSLMVDVIEEHLVEPVLEPLKFLHGLRRIGADIPAPGIRPMPAGRLRRVMRAWTIAGHAGMTYHLLYALARRPS